MLQAKVSTLQMALEEALQANKGVLMLGAIWAIFWVCVGIAFVMEVCE